LNSTSRTIQKSNASILLQLANRDAHRGLHHPEALACR